MTVSRILILGLCLSAAAPLSAVPVKVEVEGVGRDLERNIRSVLSLEKEDKDKLTPDRVRRLHDRAPEEIGEALQPFGYYKPVVRGELRQEGERFIARYEVDEGPAIKIASVDLQITGAGADDPGFRRITQEFPVQRGKVLYHPDYEKGKDALVELAAENGYLDAEFDVSEVRVDLERYRADVVVHYDTGPRYRFGDVRFDQDVVDPNLLTGYVNFKRGEPLDVDKVLELQDALSDSPYWARVEVVTRQDLAQNLEVPIEVNLVPAKPQLWTAGVGYGTDTGARGTLGLELRRINRRGHRGQIQVVGAETEQSFQASYQIPGPYPRTDVLSFNTAYALEDTDTAESETYLIGAQRTQSRGGWRETLSLNYQRDDFEVGLDQGISDLLVPGASYERVKADDRIYTTKGYRLRLGLQGAEGSLLSSSTFLQASMDSKLIRTLGDRHRLIARAEAGYMETDEFRELPPRFRFFAGGDRSVRGFGYQELGEKDEAGNVIGGQALLVGSLEYELRVLEKWSAAVFYDTGNAFRAFGDPLEYGAGFGVRWRSPIGPIRADMAWALSDPDRPFRFHLNIGPDL
ncbi:MAG TPA: autotransporter assembly complex family protein [Thermoanaerobaculia bacterium]|nr:autotransporter assembly complex family protein [Thermoanaerobaculia bacterium]